MEDIASHCKEMLEQQKYMQVVEERLERLNLNNLLLVNVQLSRLIHKMVHEERQGIKTSFPPLEGEEKA
jgi:hypothetical protein